MTFILYGLFYVVGTLAILGVFAVLALWLRWAIICAYAMIPLVTVFYVPYLFLFALPINLFFDGTPFEKKVVIFSHQYQSFIIDIFWFGCTAPFKLIALAITILQWMVS